MNLSFTSIKTHGNTIILLDSIYKLTHNHNQLHFAYLFIFMASNQLHIVLFPFMAQGHLIPLTDIGRLLAYRGIIVTIVTTPVNAARIKPILTRAIESGFQIRLVELPFPAEEAGLPKGAENFDLLKSDQVDYYMKFFTACIMMEESAEKLFQELNPRPNCIIADMCLPYTSQIANKYQIPRIAFQGFSCFCLLCLHNLHVSKVADSIESEKEYFAIPNMPDKVEFTKIQLPLPKPGTPGNDFFEKMTAAEQCAYGVVINTFEELESAYVKQFRKEKNGKVWCVGPVSLCNKEKSDKVQRGNKSYIDEEKVSKWLDKQEQKSVIYVCLGSINDLGPLQLIELGLGLEESKKPFIWVIRGNENSKEVIKWIEENRFEERVEGRGLIIWGWSPQVLILSHPAVGGFLTHCGWNSTIEGICNGVPLVTWPLFGDQFCNEKLVVQILEIAVRVGVEEPRRPWEGENSGVFVKKENVTSAVERLMAKGEESEERRKRVEKLAEIAKKSVEEGGSSYDGITQLIEDIRTSSSTD